MAGLSARCGASVYLVALRGAIAARLSTAVRVAFVHGVLLLCDEIMVPKLATIRVDAA